MTDPLEELEGFRQGKNILVKQNNGRYEELRDTVIRKGDKKMYKKDDSWHLENKDGKGYLETSDFKTALRTLKNNKLVKDNDRLKD